jgi:hypothetical protein
LRTILQSIFICNTAEKSDAEENIAARLRTGSGLLFE